MRRFFAAMNDCGSETSHGFRNTWSVYVFNSKKARDEWVDRQSNITAMTIKANEVTYYARNWSMTANEYVEPKPFSGEFWGIVNDDYNLPRGMIGVVEVSNEYDPILIERLYK